MLMILVHDLFEGTLAQFSDCFFVTDSREEVEAWVLERGYTAEFMEVCEECYRLSAGLYGSWPMVCTESCTKCRKARN